MKHLYIYLLSLLLATSMAIATSITTTAPNDSTVSQTILNKVNSAEVSTIKAQYKPNERVSVNVHGQLSGDKDWAAIYRVGNNNDWGNVIAWNWVGNGTTELNIIKHQMPAGEYEIRLFFHNSYTVEATHRFIVSDNDAVVPYTPDALPTNMLANEAMNMNPNHPRFNHWINPENISNGTLNLVAQYDHSSYTLPRDIWLPHHKYTVVWDMETTGHVGMDTFPVVRFNSLGYFSQGYQNSVLNQKETLYTVIASKDDLNNNSYKSFSFYLMHALPNSRVKISNIRIYEGVIEIEKPTLKDTNFQGSMTMDKEGIFRRNGSVVFPITIYKANDLITRGVRSAEQYIAQGITGTLIEAHSEHWYDAREDRISKMITAGMTTMSIPITNYLKYPTYALGTYYFSDFINIMHTFEQDNQMWDSITTLTIDNEFYHQNQQFKESINAIRDSIPHKPIQMLNGVEAISAWYNDYIDITGTYISNDNEVNSNHPEATTNIHLLEAQRLTPNLHVPATLLQINQGTAENFGSILMAGVALGGTKLEYWKDSDELFNGFRNLAMPTLPMWNQLPTLRTYLDKMCDLGIIETTPYIGFKVKQTNDKYEYIKARLDKNNKAYVIASNMTSMDTPRTVVFDQNYTGLYYVPSGQLKDIMTGEVKGSIDPVSNKIKITLAPHTWAVLEVEMKPSSGRDNSIVLTSGEEVINQIANRGDYKYYKIYVHAGERVNVDLYNQDANGNLYVKVGEKASKENYDCKSENGGETHSTEHDSCSLLVERDSFVYIAVHATIYGCYTNVKHSVMAYLGDYGDEGPYEVLKYDSGNTRSYYPNNVDKSPVVIFLPGWRDNTFDSLMRYDKLLHHIASQGYTVITKLAGTTMDEHFNVDFSDVLDAISANSSDLDTKRVGVIGWSHGGGLSFAMMRELVNAGYGTEGRFIMPIEPMFAIGMDQQYMHQLNNMNFVMMRFESLEEDPRTNFVEYKLVDGENIDKNYINLEKHEHTYLLNVPKPFARPMDALMAYTLKNNQDAHDIALEGAGKDNPKNVETPLDTERYNTSCATSNYWANHRVESVMNDIDYCADVY